MPTWSDQTDEHFDDEAPPDLGDVCQLCTANLFRDRSCSNPKCPAFFDEEDYANEPEDNS